MMGPNGPVLLYKTQRRLEVLSVLLSARGPVSRAHIVEVAEIQPPVAHRILIFFERNRWVTSERVPGRTGHLVYILTPHGRAEASYLIDSAYIPKFHVKPRRNRMQRVRGHITLGWLDGVVITPTRLRILRALAHAEEPARTALIAEASGVPYNTAYGLINLLAKRNLVSAKAESTGAPHRPFQRYALTTEGRTQVEAVLKEVG